MKKFLAGCIRINTLLLFIICVSNAHASCDSLPHIVVRGSFQFRFGRVPIPYQYPHTISEEGVKQSYSSPFELEVEKLKCYVGGIQLLDRNKNIIGRDTTNYHLLDFSNEKSLRFEVLTSGEYADFLRLTLGVDSLTNAAGIHCCALDPSNGMYWSWQSGYIQFKLEGKVKGNQALTLHLGGFSHAHMSSLTLDIPIQRMITGGPPQNPSKRRKDLKVDINLNELLELIDANGEYTIMSPNQQVPLYMETIGKNTFVKIQ